MSKFQVGERVAFYSGSGRVIVEILELNVVIENPLKCGEKVWGMTALKFESGFAGWGHPKQLRKLKKRRAVWIKRSDMQGSQIGYTAAIHIDPINKSLFIKFIEAKEK